MTFIMLTFIGTFGLTSNPTFVNCNKIATVQQRKNETAIRLDGLNLEVKEKAKDIVEVCVK